MQTSFAFSFVGDSAAVITVSTVISNIITPLLSSQYTLNLNAAQPNQLWGVGGSVTYPIVGSPLATGSYLLIQRILPLTQQVSIRNQGNVYPQVTEQGLDILEMQIQQLNSKTTQFRGTWATNTVYNVGDIVQDGLNGNNTLNYYICQTGNTSSVWATDLANGDWVISVLATIPFPITTLTGAVTGSNSGGTIATTLSPNVVGTTNVIVNSISNAKLVQEPALTILGNNTAATTNVSYLSVAQVNTLLGTSPIGTSLPGQLPGTSTNDTAGTGNVGEIIIGDVPGGGPVSLVSGVAKNLTSISLSPGDWDVWCAVQFTGTALTTVTNMGVSISTVANILNTSNTQYTVQPFYGLAPFNYAIPVSLITGPTRISVTSTVSVFAVSICTFGTSNCSVYGQMRARRER